LPARSSSPAGTDSKKSTYTSGLKIGVHFNFTVKGIVLAPEWRKLQLGEDPDGQAGSIGGMIFDVRYQTIKRGLGGLTQLFTADYSWPGPSFTERRADGGEWYHDGHQPVDINPGTSSIIIPFQDFPSNKGPIRNRLKAAFDVYVRFAPEGEDSIFVTLGIIRWNIDAEIDWVDFPNTWNYLKQSTPDPTGPDGSDEFPTWNKIFKKDQ
jgi:hypothetical protein